MVSLEQHDVKGREAVLGNMNNIGFHIMKVRPSLCWTERCLSVFCLFVFFFVCLLFFVVVVFLGGVALGFCLCVGGGGVVHVKRNRG